MDSRFAAVVKVLGLMLASYEEKECVKFKVEYGEWPDLSTPPATFYALRERFKKWVRVSPGLSLLMHRVTDPEGWLDILCNTKRGSVLPF